MATIKDLEKVVETLEKELSAKKKSLALARRSFSQRIGAKEDLKVLKSLKLKQNTWYGSAIGDSCSFYHIISISKKGLIDYLVVYRSGDRNILNVLRVKEYARSFGYLKLNLEKVLFEDIQRSNIVDCCLKSDILSTRSYCYYDLRTNHLCATRAELNKEMEAQYK